MKKGLNPSNNARAFLTQLNNEGFIAARDRIFISAAIYQLLSPYFDVSSQNMFEKELSGHVLPAYRPMPNRHNHYESWTIAIPRKAWEQAVQKQLIPEQEFDQAVHSFEIAKAKLG